MKIGAAPYSHGVFRPKFIIALLMTAYLSLASLFADPVADFDKTSLTLRTALHYDPSVLSPLQKLVDQYRAVGRSEELVALYVAHLTQYPQDANSKLVLARVYMALRDKRAEAFLKSAVTQHPDHALLVWQQAMYMESQHDAKAIEEMAKAVALEKSAVRRAQWFGELMKAVSVQGREDLLLVQTKQLIDEGALNGEQRLRWARQAVSYKLFKTATAMLQELNPESLSTDGSVEVALLQAEVMSANGQTKEAGQALDALLGKLAPDYWRRREVFMLRLDLSSSGEREALVELARSKWNDANGKTEVNALTFADVLEASHRSHESLGMLREASNLLPKSRVIESRLLDAWDKDGVTEDSLSWLADKIKQNPSRDDLALRQVRWMFAVNQSTQALSAFTGLMGKLPEIQQVERSMELARWLRRRNQLTEASNVLEAIMQRAVNRWDLRRELAELYLVQQRKEDAAKLFIGDWSRDLANDTRLEIAQFLLNKQWWTEAKTLLAPWLAQQKDAFDGILLLTKIHEKLGEDESVELMLSRARALCDTDMRYQAWLTTAWDYAESREHQERWFNAEATRLSSEIDEANPLSNFNRWVALIELAQSHQEIKLAEVLLIKRMAMAVVPDDKKRVLEKLKLDLVSADTTRATETESGLRKMMQEDDEHAEDYRLRLILFYAKMERSDLTAELINKLNAAKCTEAAQLRAVITLLQAQGGSSLALACAERLTQLEPGDRACWSQWMSLLVQEGREEQLRYALRVVISKAHDWSLKTEILEDLQKHLLTSHWRGILRELNGGDDSWAAARRAAVELDTLDLTQEQRRWTDWLLAFLSGKLGDIPAVQDALNKFKKLDEKQWIPFPDGMELSVSQGRLWLERLLKNEEEPSRKVTDRGPLAPFTMRWGFALDENVIINKVLLSADSKMVYLCDDRQQIHALDCMTGKLRWELNITGASADGAALKNARLTLPVRGGSSGARPRYNNGQADIKLPVALAEFDHHLCYISGDQVICVKSETGELLWKNNLSDDSSSLSMAQQTLQSRIGIMNDCVVVWQPGSSVVSALHLMSGKLSWQTKIPAPANPPYNPNNNWGGYDQYSMMKTGLSMADGTVFVSHKSAALLRIDDGTVLWRLSSESTPSFPIELNSSDEEGFKGILSNAPYQIAVISGSSVSMARMRHMGGMSNPRWTYGNGVSAVLQGNYAGYALMHHDQIWAISGSGTAEISMMGLPLSQHLFNGTIAGFAGDVLIGINGQSIEAVSLNRKATGTLLTKRSNDADASGIEYDDTSVAVSDTRVYQYANGRLRAADVRNGTVLFDVTLPEEAKAWKKTFVKEVAPLSIPGFAMRQQSNNRRSYLPKGILLQDNQGGGVILENTSVATQDFWIFPVSNSGMVCLSGIATETTQPNATSP